MSGNEAFELVSGTGWNRGLRNMLRSGLARWFKTKTWWIHCLIWGGMAAIIVTFGRVAPTIMELLMISFIFTGLFPAVGVVIIMQDTIVGGENRRYRLLGALQTTDTPGIRSFQGHRQ